MLLEDTHIVKWLGQRACLKTWLHGCGDGTRRHDSLLDARCKVVRVVQAMLTTSIYIRLLALRNRKGTATQFKTEFQLATGQRVSTQTVRNRLQNDTMNARRPATGPILTRAHRIQRLEFRDNHLNWEMRDCQSVLFTNESRFHMTSCDRRVRVWRRPGERYTYCNILEHDAVSDRREGHTHYQQTFLGQFDFSGVAIGSSTDTMVWIMQSSTFIINAENM